MGLSISPPLISFLSSDLLPDFACTVFYLVVALLVAVAALRKNTA